MATPVVLCGISKAMGERVASRLLPQFEVIQFITSVDRAKSEISMLMTGRKPPPDPDNIGSHHFGKPPKMVIFGRGFEREHVEDVRKACGGTESKLAWVSANAEGVARVKANPPVMNDPKGLDVYADSIVADIKKTLSDVNAQGEEGVDGDYYY